MISEGLVDFRLQYEISPIFLTGGIASNLAGGMLPIISLTQAVDFNSLQQGALDTLDLDQFFAHFQVLPGGQLLNNELGEYPFANQTIAANAIIAQPLRFSMIMRCPVNQPGGYANKLATMQAVQAALYQHSSLGGTYTVATPSYFYTDAVLIKLTDVTGEETKQPQALWQWDFEQPLITQLQATQAQNTLMQKMANALPVAGDPPAYSGPDAAVGDPQSGVAPSVIPAARSMPAALGTSSNQQ